MNLRSLLFVPADRPERFAKAAGSGADAIIIDLEDSVSLSNKEMGREAAANWLQQNDGTVKSFVRVNPMGSGMTLADLEAVLPHMPDGIVLPKAEGAASVQWLRSLMPAIRASGEFPSILPIATETPRGVFELGSFGQCGNDIMGISWGAEDLPAAIGAATSREADGRYTPPYEMVRSLCLFASHSAGAAAIDTVFPNIKDEDGLTAYAARAARDGFTGMMAIHPAQVAIINKAFTPTKEQLEKAIAIVEAFTTNPNAGVLQVDGQMVDAPHLKAAQKILERAKL
ncbi:CoA ester lyase [Sphingorhabdus lutea]|uniref:CoA ester lyase n=1 Tax=Sphingorhabdus lutea TaxID=1913578 RepID=A0A1L3JA39_9SPHN|nr:CoA ester lyase [Sphingorhabdus lutea]APG61933.1 CoA ester lyase [Sphingorhabdus lutea]